MSRKVTESKGDLRRRKIVEAAESCFIEEGFHGTSIARIAKKAGMSTGHISHYFPQKEQIIYEIVKKEENELIELLQVLDKKTQQCDFLDAMSEEMDNIIDYVLDPKHVALVLEIAAEAARNPSIASIMREGENRKFQKFSDFAGDSNSNEIAKLDENERIARLDMLPLLLSGVIMRSVYTQIDRKQIAILIMQTLTSLWKPAKQ